jgi:hypothetical protein
MMLEFGKGNLRCVDSKFRKGLFPYSKRRTAAQRRGRDRAVVVIARSEMGVIEIFRVLDNIRNLSFL